ncbi:MAG: hypothetical protein Q8O89_07985 [Nanoarchaeota archaeon]|nr:hypothetical protein [Nanoarchaeota archaeon]
MEHNELASIVLAKYDKEKIVKGIKAGLLGKRKLSVRSLDRLINDDDELLRLFNAARNDFLSDAQEKGQTKEINDLVNKYRGLIFPVHIVTATTSYGNVIKSPFFQLGTTSLLESLLDFEYSVNIIPDLAKNRTLNEFYQNLNDNAYGIEKGFSVAFISTNTADFQIAAKAAKTIKELSNGNAMIFVGGPHFQDENINKESLLNYDFDIVNVGHGKPSIDLVKMITRAEIDFSKKDGKYLFKGDMPEGVRYLNQKKIFLGSGEGSFPYVKNEMPIVLETTRFKGTEITYGVSIITGDNCPNRCGFCSINKKNLKFGAKEFINSYKKYAKPFNPTGLALSEMTLEDSNPLSKINRKATLAFFKELRDSGIHLSKSIYAEPALFNARECNELYKVIIKEDIRTFFFGRDAVTEQENRFLKRRVGNKLRDQDNLDKELDNLIDLFYFLEKQDKKYGMAISYIIHPGMDYESTMKKFDEMNDLNYLGASAKNVKVQIHFNIIIPSPNTELWNENEGQFMPPHLIGDFKINPFGYAKNLPASHTLDYMTAGMKLMEKGKISPSDILFRLATDIGFKKYEPKMTMKRLLEDDHAKGVDRLYGKQLKKVDNEIASKKLYQFHPNRKAEYFTAIFNIFSGLPKSEIQNMSQDYHNKLVQKNNYLRRSE